MTENTEMSRQAKTDESGGSPGDGSWRTEDRTRPTRSPSTMPGGMVSGSSVLPEATPTSRPSASWRSTTMTGEDDAFADGLKYSDCRVSQGFKERS